MPRLPRSLYALCFAVFVAYMGGGMVGTVRVLFVRHQGGSLGIISAMTAAFLVANFVCQYPWGWLSDRWGRRTVLVIGLVLQSVVGFLYITVNDPVLFVVLRVFEGAAAASSLPVARAAIADMVPDELRGRAYGIFAAFLNMGFLFGPAAGGLLAVVGYAWVFVIAGILRFAGAAGVLLALGSMPVRPIPTEAETGMPAARARDLLNFGLVAAYVIAFGDYLWLGFEMTLAPLWMRHHLGATLPLIGLTYSAWALPNAIMSPIGGRLADRHRRWVLILVGGLSQIPMYLMYAFAGSIYPVMAGFAVQATLYAVISPAVDAHVAHASPAALRGRVQSVYSAVGTVGAFAGATVFVPLYAISFRLPLIALATGYAVLVMVGGLMVRAWSLRTPAGTRVPAGLSHTA